MQDPLGELPSSTLDSCRLVLPNMLDMQATLKVLSAKMPLRNVFHPPSDEIEEWLAGQKFSLGKLSKCVDLLLVNVVPTWDTERQ